MTEVMMAANADFSQGEGLDAIARGLSRASGIQVCGDVLKVTAVFGGLLFVVLLLLATAALSTGFF
jgi:hypothetical protein